VVTRLALVVSGALVGFFAGLWAGDQAALLFEDGDTLAGIAYVATGGGAGPVLGALIGGFLLRRRARRRALALLGFVVGTALALTGSWYIGDFTNADGPGGVEPFMGILLLPLGVLVIGLSARATVVGEPRLAAPIRDNGNDTREVRS
jgi:Na+/proline symporter